MENYWEINGNFWSCDEYSYDEALEASKTLKECKNCLNCYDCINCESCISCERCEACKACKDCLNGKDYNYLCGGTYFEVKLRERKK